MLVFGPGDEINLILLVVAVGTDGYRGTISYINQKLWAPHDLIYCAQICWTHPAFRMFSLAGIFIFIYPIGNFKHLYKQVDGLISTLYFYEDQLYVSYALTYFCVQLCNFTVCMYLF